MVNKQDLQLLAADIAADNQAKHDHLVSMLNKFSGDMKKWQDSVEARIHDLNNNIGVNRGRIDRIEQEIIWRDMKRRQALINGVNESNAPSDKVRAGEDKAAVAAVFDAMGCSEKINEVKFIRRIGKSVPGKNRPICIGFYDEANRDQVLRYSSKLNDSRFKDVRIQADLTKLQRSNFKDQMELVKQKNAAKEGLQEGQEWRVVSPRGNTRVIRTTIRK